MPAVRRTYSKQASPPPHHLSRTNCCWRAFFPGFILLILFSFPSRADSPACSRWKDVEPRNAKNHTRRRTGETLGCGCGGHVLTGSCGPCFSQPVFVSPQHVLLTRTAVKLLDPVFLSLFYLSAVCGVVGVVFVGFFRVQAAQPSRSARPRSGGARLDDRRRCSIYTIAAGWHPRRRLITSVGKEAPFAAGFFLACRMAIPTSGRRGGKGKGCWFARVVKPEAKRAEKPKRCSRRYLRQNPIRAAPVCSQFEWHCAAKPHHRHHRQCLFSFFIFIFLFFFLAHPMFRNLPLFLQTASRRVEAR